jgi:hypothetical protein
MFVCLYEEPNCWYQIVRRLLLLGIEKRDWLLPRWSRRGEPALHVQLCRVDLLLQQQL